MRRLLGALLAVLVAGAAWAQNTNDPREQSGPMPRQEFKSERELEQERRSDAAGGPLKLPAWPKDENLVEVFVSDATRFRFFIDAAALSVSDDSVVRYTLVARSSSGVDNVSYEGMRCGGAGLARVYAYGQGGRWSLQKSEWRDIDPSASPIWRRELRSRYFCPNGGSIHSAAEGLDALRRGGHPEVESRLQR
ncbi:MAG TPA: CNP1-like family protein [Burkholderiaceae bacterium]